MLSHRIAAQRAVILTVIKACKDTTLGELLELLSGDRINPSGSDIRNPSTSA